MTATCKESNYFVMLLLCPFLFYSIIIIIYIFYICNWNKILWCPFSALSNLILLNLYYNVKLKVFFTFDWFHDIASHKLLRSHTFTSHYFNIYFLIEFKFYSIIKLFIRILTHHIFFNRKNIFFHIYKHNHIIV